MLTFYKTWFPYFIISLLVNNGKAIYLFYKYLYKNDKTLFALKLLTFYHYFTIRQIKPHRKIPGDKMSGTAIFLQPLVMHAELNDVKANVQ